VTEALEGASAFPQVTRDAVQPGEGYLAGVLDAVDGVREARLHLSDLSLQRGEPERAATIPTAARSAARLDAEELLYRVGQVGDGATQFPPERVHLSAAQLELQVEKV